MALASKELRKFVESDEEAEKKLRRFVGELARPQFERLGWQPRPNEPESETKMRSLIIGLMLYAEDSSIEEKCMRMFEQGVEQIDPELRHLVIGAAVKYSTDNTV